VTPSTLLTPPGQTATAPPPVPAGAYPAVSGGTRSIQVPTRHRRLTTPTLLKLDAVLIAVAVAGLWLATQAAAGQHEQALQTIGADSTRSIVAAQRIKAGLAEMDALASRVLLLEPGSRTKEAAGRYEEVRGGVHQDVGLALRNVNYGVAEEVPSQHIQFILPIYHSLVDQAWRAHEARDDATAVERYRTANQLMRDRLLPAADALDKVNTYALNQAHQQQRSAASRNDRFVLATGAVLIVLFLAAQGYLFVRFRRLVNSYLLAATVVAAVFLLYATSHFSSANHHLVVAKEDAFDSVHVLERARAKAFEIRAQENLLILDPSRASQNDEALAAQDQRILRLPDRQSNDAALQAFRRGQVPDDLGGYLATELRSASLPAVKQSTTAAAVAYLQWLSNQATLRDAVRKGNSGAAPGLLDTSDRTFQGFGPALAKVISITQTQFDTEIASARDGLSGFGVGLGRLGLVVALVTALLTLRGLSQRWGEYGT
jgi:hypothetical protein